MRRDYRGREEHSVFDIVHGDIADIDDSDFILVNATRPSWGTAMEIVYAFLRQKPIFSFVGDAPVSPWLAYHSNKVLKTLDEAIDEINARAITQAA